jgi:glycosyltransferase involved in cell wall biosynthesis
MVATSYPRFPGDGIGSFMEPIAKGVAARGHEVHLVAPWHPAITRPAMEDGVVFHFYRYAPVAGLNVFGYAAGLRADTRLKTRAWLAAPAAVAAGWFTASRVAAAQQATVVHAHWVVPGGTMASLAARRTPLVVSLHGSDVYVAERYAIARHAARRVFRRAAWVTACSEDLRHRALALGARAADTETLPYGVDAGRFAPDPRAREEVRAELGIAAGPLVVTAGRLVAKKGFEFLIDAVHQLAADFPTLTLVIAGDGDLRASLTARAAAGPGRIRFAGSLPQHGVARLLAAADAVVIPSVHDAHGNVDGLPNFALEALASATPVVATRAGGLAQAVIDGVTGRLVEERNAGALAGALREIFGHSAEARTRGRAARDQVTRAFGWGRVAERLEAAYDRAHGRSPRPGGDGR